MQPHYYLMQRKKILRLEAHMSFASLPKRVKDLMLDKSEVVALDQNQANWRVVIFRDEIMEYQEYLEWLMSPEALEDESLEDELEIAN